ncbi:Hypothetical predicted protein [Paramuricea clavata]|uniref:Uncharacterized protein n=1 Tax=Paramuricea clavata TaxID=317549 RepID=A0A6S7K438_PARCT|nr:Hypothetical predicted protein [Paramuricea clavata]
MSTAIISLWCHANSFSVLGELHTSCGETEEGQPEIISTSKAKHDERKSRTEKKRGTVIVGNSMVKGLHQHKLANSVNQNVGENQKSNGNNEQYRQFMSRNQGSCQEIKEEFFTFFKNFFQKLRPRSCPLRQKYLTQIAVLPTE